MASRKFDVVIRGVNASFTIDDAVDVPCKCGGTLVLGFEEETRDPALLHTMPFCRWFEGASLDDVTAHAREHRLRGVLAS